MGLETGAPEMDILSYIFGVEPADPEKPVSLALQLRFATVY